MGTRRLGGCNRAHHRGLVSRYAESSSQLADAAASQASSLEEISAALTDLASEGKSNLDAARTAEELIKKSNHAAHETKRAVEEMVGAMARIRNSSNEITRILKAIESIAFQTNLLALNAAVEAARAGMAEDLRSWPEKSEHWPNDPQKRHDGLRS